MEPVLSDHSSDGPRAVVHIYLVGAGIMFPEQLTIETIDVLAKCARICTNLPEPRLAGLPQDLYEKCFSLWPLYQDGRKRTLNYRDILNAIIEIAETATPIAWLTPGHPIIFDSISTNLLKESKARGWEVRVIPAVSSIDTLLAELRYDPASGLLIHEATALVNKRITVPRSIALLLLQPGVFQVDVAIVSDSGNAGVPDLAPLRDYLLEFYPADHHCAFIRSSSNVGERNLITWQQIRDFASMPYTLVAGTTLYVPPANVL